LTSPASPSDPPLLRGERPRDRLELKDPAQHDAYRSPWTFREKVGIALFALSWLLLCRWTPGPVNPWRLVILRTFGCRIEGRPYVAASARIRVPWQLTLEDRACLGDRAEVYNLGDCVLRSRCTVAQQSYLCGGSHDLSKRALPLVVAPIEIGEDAFLGARSFIMPGVVVGQGGVVGAGAVVTRDVPPWTVVAGNPSVRVGDRRFVD